MSSTIEATPQATVAPAPAVAGSAAPASVQALKTLDFLPIGLFGSVMSLTGLSVAWRLAERTFDSPAWVSMILQYLSTTTFVVLVVCYLIKCFAAPQAVKTEFNHPIISNLFGTLIISMLLQPIVIAQWSLPLARTLWVLGAIAMTMFAWMMVTRWMSRPYQMIHATPAWIVPVVGMLDIPLGVPSLDLPPLHGVMTLALAVGLFYAIPVFTMVMMRLAFEEPMPNALAPTLLILVAPFAVGVSAYFVTTGVIDLFAEALYALDLFVLATLFGRLRYLRGCCPFRLTWWAVGFPLAASAIAALRIQIAHPDIVFASLAALMLGVTTVFIAGLVIRTLIGVFNGELRHLSS